MATWGTGRGNGDLLPGKETGDGELLTQLNRSAS